MKNGWKIVPMGKLCSISSGESDTQDAVADGPYAFFDRSKTLKRSSRFLYDCEALIIPGEGKEFLPKHFKGKFDLHQRAYALFDFLPELDVRFLYHLLHYRSDYFPSVAVGATVKSLRRRHFDNLPVPVPPLPEQQRIVAILDEAFDGIATAKANAERNLQNARAIFESHVQSVFSQRGEGWIEKRLTEVSRVFGRGKSKHRPRNDPKLYKGPYPFIQTGEISNADHWLTAYTQTYSELGLAQSHLWPKGTICIAIVGATVGETAILDFEACFPDSVIGIVVDDKLADMEYVEFLLQAFKALLKEKGKGTARDNINLGTFENQKFPFPTLKIQQEIVATLNDLAAETQHLANIYERKLAALEALKKSLLHSAFSEVLTARPTKDRVEAAA
jgi:type I restriction enzyme, S subunit